MPSFNKTLPQSSVMLNCGIFGSFSDGKDADYIQQLECNCTEVGRRNMLSAQNHYSKQSFWEIFDIDDYDRHRSKHSAAKAFPPLHKKTCGTPALQNAWG
jgi:hypothetical protein